MTTARRARTKMRKASRDGLCTCPEAPEPHAQHISADVAAYSKPARSSSALRIACSICGALAGEFCKKYDGTVSGGSEQTIAHKHRREEEVRTRPWDGVPPARDNGLDG